MPNGPFCWTKMGAEAGQQVEDILRRKEFERQCGNGVFSWGIGNSLGYSVEAAQQTQLLAGNRELDVYFTHMKSRPKPEDVNPARVLLWLGYLDRTNLQADLPEHVVITSRAPSQPGAVLRHYALMCRSDQLLGQDSHPDLNAAVLRNYLSGKLVGSSQVTAIVETVETNDRDSPSAYKVAMKPTLVSGGYVKLAKPVEVTPRLRAMLDHAFVSRNADEWRERTSQLRLAAR